MRVLIDTNIFISYILDPKKDEKLQYIVDAGFHGEYTLILPQEVLEELKEKLAVKPYLAQRISQSERERFIAALSAVTELLPPIAVPIPQIIRDKKDDYLIAYAAVGEADYLVSGDDDVHTLKQVGTIKIVSPTEFYEIVKKL